ncbi:MAG: amino acid ABC transporter ATP-binding protein [Phycisphaeraceae bacterium]
MIKVEGVSFWYPDGTQALENIDVEFPPGTISAVLGESGSGKTTMLMALGQFLRPQQGKVTYDGVDIFEMPEKAFRQKLGIVFQKLYLFPHLSVIDNMTLACRHVRGMKRKDAERDAREMLERLAISDLADSYPNQISGGQAQRAAIARGLMLRPEYMLLDEPTSALDANTTEGFSNWLIELQGQTNFIIVTHDILFARQTASQGVYLSNGQVLDCGSVENIIAHVQQGELVEAGE